MYGNSRAITSAQDGIHDGLLRALQRHAAAPFQRPIGPAARAAYGEFLAWRAPARPLILDAGCGVGDSTRALAAAFPTHQVLGVDQSADRLARQRGVVPDNALLLRADLVDFWRLLAADGIGLDRHYLLYPNPWPKIGQLGRRWHGHPVFPALLALGGRLECRSNWRIYVDEWARAVQVLTGVVATVEAWSGAAGLTPFERKYRDSGQALWRGVADLGAALPGGAAATTRPG